MNKESGLVPLLFFQEFLFNKENLSPELPVMDHEQIIYRCKCDSDDLKIDDLLAYLSQRHPVLNTRIVYRDNRPHLQYLSGSEFDILHLDADGQSDPESYARRAIRNFASKKFDLSASPPIRGLCVRLSDNEQLIGVVVHHTAGDGRSYHVIRKDLLAYLRGTGRQVEPAPTGGLSFAEYVQRREDARSSSDELTLERFWTERLKHARKQDGAGFNQTKSPDESKVVGREFTLAKGRMGDLSGLARQGLTPNILFLSSYVYALRELTGAIDVAAVCQSSGRVEIGTDDLVGCIVECIPLVTNTSDVRSYSDLARCVRASYIECLSKIPASFSRILDELGFWNEGTPFLNWMSSDMIFNSDDACESYDGIIKIEPYSPDPIDKMLVRSTASTYSMFVNVSDDSIKGSFYYMDCYSDDIVSIITDQMDVFLHAILDSPDLAISGW